MHVLVAAVVQLRVAQLPQVVRRAAEARLLGVATTARRAHLDGARPAAGRTRGHVVEDGVDAAVDERHHERASEKRSRRERVGRLLRVGSLKVFVRDADDLHERDVDHDTGGEGHGRGEERAVERGGAQHEARADARRHPRAETHRHRGVLVREAALHGQEPPTKQDQADDGGAGGGADEAQRDLRGARAKEPLAAVRIVLERLVFEQRVARLVRGWRQSLRAWCG
mmetsp:Transcript_35618/g.98537  ORF Transcript_35618/g.98537 Transcript_35618/m.98537 type:complete len:226 (-) Transcript_35618:17-694(-)